jgi:TonB family protein
VKNNYKRLPIFFLLALAASFATAQDAEHALKQFEDKILMLRHPLQGSSLRYDADGKVLKGGDEGPWTVFGGILIDHASLSADKLHITGRLMLVLFPHQRFSIMEFKRLNNRPKNPPFSTSVKLEIALAHPVGSAEEARTVMNRVFALNTAELLDSISDFWRPSLMDSLIYDPSQSKETEFQWREKVPPAQKLSREPVAISKSENADADSAIFRVGPEVKAPKVQYTPEPEFTEIARYEKYPGVAVVNMVVDKNGNVQHLKLVRPLGLGLDESAQATLKTWRFLPGRGPKVAPA